jgi:serine/threonine protein kinase
VVRLRALGGLSVEDENSPLLWHVDLASNPGTPSHSGRSSSRDQARRRPPHAAPAPNGRRGDHLNSRATAFHCVMPATACPECFTPPEIGCNCNSGGARAQQSPRTSFALPRGKVLHGQYLVGRVLGSGGFGVTYLTWDERLARRAAIKEYFPRDVAIRDRDAVIPIGPTERAPFEHGLKGFLAEARALAKFDHPNIVQVQTYFEADGTGYLVMPYYDGVDLGTFLRRRGRLSEKDALAIMLPVLDGLRAVHERSLLHRDIKPQNIYLAKRPQITPILLDFGAARLAVGEKSRNLSVIWTDGYAPLEQYSMKGQQGPWTDIYACGATLYHLVAGAVPPNAPERVSHDTLVPLRRLDSRLSPSFCAAVERALAVAPAARPQCVSDFKAMLSSPPRPGPPPRQDLAPDAGLQVVWCKVCGARNRSRYLAPGGARPSGHPHCGKCGSPLDG